MSRFKVLVSDKLSEAGLQVLRDASGVLDDVHTELTETELCEVIGEHDGLVIGSMTAVTPRVLEAAKTPKVVGRAGVDVDNVDLTAANMRGVVVMNTHLADAVSVAELALPRLMALAPQIPKADASMKRGARALPHASRVSYVTL